MPKTGKRVAGKEEFRERLAQRARKFEEIFQEICALQGYDRNSLAGDFDEYREQAPDPLKI